MEEYSIIQKIVTICGFMPKVCYNTVYSEPIFCFKKWDHLDKGGVTSSPKRLPASLSFGGGHSGSPRVTNPSGSLGARSLLGQPHPGCCSGPCWCHTHTHTHTASQPQGRAALPLPTGGSRGDRPLVPTMFRS